MARTLDASVLLGRLDSDPVGRVVEALVAASSDPARRGPIREAIKLVQETLLNNEKRPILPAEHLPVFLPLARSFGLLPLDRSAIVETLLVAMHARATDLLQTCGSGAVLQKLEGLPDRVKSGMKTMRSDVLGEFLVATVMGAASSPRVSRELAESAEALRRQVHGFALWEKAAKTILREKGTIDPDCACHTVPTCEPEVGCVSICLPLWICLLLPIIIIIIIIIGSGL